MHAAAQAGRERDRRPVDPVQSPPAAVDPHVDLRRVPGGWDSAESRQPVAREARGEARARAFGGGPGAARIPLAPLAYHRVLLGRQRQILDPAVERRGYVDHRVYAAGAPPATVSRVPVLLPERRSDAKCSVASAMSCGRMLALSVLRWR